MKQMDREILDEGDMETVKLLTACGCNGNEAKCLCFLLSHETAMAPEIEIAMDMRQPEVSVGLTALFDKGLISYKKIPAEGKGRPKQKYTLDGKEIVHKELKKTLMDVIRDANVHMNDIDELFLALK
jgi:predicted transcriptional regulator